METKTKIIVFISRLLFLLFIFTILKPDFEIYSQERGPLKRYKWYYSQRNYPYDTITQGAYGDAITDRNSLRSTNGYQMSSQVTWQPIGPAPFQWVNGLICSGRVNNIKYDLRDGSGNTIYLTAAEGGVWKSTNNGNNWTDISGDLPTLSSGGFAIDTENNILYYGSGDPAVYYGSEKGTGVYKSTNDGINWIKISTGLPASTVIYKIEISPNNPDVIFLAEFRGLYKTTNATTNTGATWSKVLPTSGSLICSDVIFSPSGNYVYAVGPSVDYWPNSWFNGIGYYRSSDGGNSFSEVSESSGFPQSTLPYGRSCLAVSQSSENLVWILSYDNYVDNLWPHVYDCRMYVYKSTNSGLNFSSYTNGTSWNMGGNAGFNEMIRCSDSDPNICFMGLQDLYRTTNGGTSWNCVGGYCGTHADCHALDFNPSDPDGKIALGDDGGIFRSDNLGTNWTSINYDLNITMIYRVAGNTYDPNVVVGGFQDYGYGYKSSGTYWITTSQGYADGTQVTASPFKSNHFSASTNAFSILSYSTDGVNFPDALDYIGSHFLVAPIANHSTEPGSIFTLRHGSLTNNRWTPISVLKSTSYGANWNGSSAYDQFTNPYELVAPNDIVVSPSDPNIIIMAMGNGSEFWHYEFGAESILLKSTNSGLDWEGIDYGSGPILVGGAGVPDRFFTHLEFDPENAEIIYLTLSGYGTGHVYKSTNGGYNWSDISSNLPNNPVNDLIVRYYGCNSKELIIATDVGVFRTDASTISWEELAEGLPNTSVSDLNYNRLSGKLRASSFGRGIHEIELSGPIYVEDRLYITDNVTLDKDIIVCDGGKLILGASGAASSMSIIFNNGSNIIVQDGGTILANTSIPITLTSSGTWAGIEVNGQSSNCILYNCTFSNTSTPVVVNGGISMGIPPIPEYGITLNDCHFTNSVVEITNRSDVNIQYCDWNNNTSAGLEAIIADGADGLYLLYNEINYSSQVTGSHAIQVSQSDNATITRSTISHCDYPITVSNGTYYIRYSDINTIYPSTSEVGIYLNGVNNGHLIANDVSGYKTAYYFNNQSSPTMLINNADGSNSNGNKYAVLCDQQSSPRLHPSVDKNNNIIWDAGLNTLRNDASNSTGLVVDNDAAPLLDYGYNTIYGTTNIYGTYPSDPWYVRCNSWINDPPVFNTNVNMEYEPTDCTPPDSRPGQNNYSIEAGSLPLENDPEIPPQPIIVNYGNGLIDTFEVGTTNATISADIGILGSGDKNMYIGSFENAITEYSNVIANFQDSNSALIAMNKIFYCYDWMNADTSEYSTLRNYYLNLASSNSNDVSFVKVASELSRKCLVQQKEYISAIDEYEHVVTNSNDSAEILAAEISIIEIYILLSTEEGDAALFTGQLGYLKPTNLQDAMNRIREKMGHKTNTIITSNVPNVFSLSQNYPNPFNPITRINYTIPNSINVSLKVYDILGRLVKTLVNEYKDAGSYFVTFDGSSLASGVYFYKIEAGNYAASKKMVLVK